MMMLMNMLLVMVMMIAGQDSVGRVGEGSQHGQIIERPLLLGSGLGQHGDGDYYNDAAVDNNDKYLGDGVYAVAWPDYSEALRPGLRSI